MKSDQGESRDNGGKTELKNTRGHWSCRMEGWTATHRETREEIVEVGLNNLGYARRKKEKENRLQPYRRRRRAARIHPCSRISTLLPYLPN